MRDAACPFSTEGGGGPPGAGGEWLRPRRGDVLRSTTLPLQRRVRLVRKEGRDVSSYYGKRDEKCPGSTGGRGEGGGALQERAAWVTAVQERERCGSWQRRRESDEGPTNTGRVRLVRGEGRGVST